MLHAKNKGFIKSIIFIVNLWTVVYIKKSVVKIYFNISCFIGHIPRFNGYRVAMFSKLYITAKGSLKGTIVT